MDLHTDRRAHGRVRSAQFVCLYSLRLLAKVAIAALCWMSGGTSSNLCDRRRSEIASSVASMARRRSLGIPETPRSARATHDCRCGSRPSQFFASTAAASRGPAALGWSGPGTGQGGVSLGAMRAAAAFAAVHASGIGTSRPVAAMANFRSPRIESGHRASAGSGSGSQEMRPQPGRHVVIPKRLVGVGNGCVECPHGPATPWIS
jgi:hypothetical protein